MTEWITPQRAGEVVQALADVPAPSQVAAWTRGPLVGRFLRDWGAPQGAWDPNLNGTGNGVLRIGSGARRPVWVLAHWDTISFLVAGRDGEAYALVPYHHHVMPQEESQPGAAVRYDPVAGAYGVVARGTITGGERPTFRSVDATPLGAGDRIVYDTPTRWLDDDRLEGQLDNAAGCAGALLATAFLARIPDVEAVTCFVDEEEGPVALGSTAFARGSPRLLHHLPHPDVAIVVDHHTCEAEETATLGRGASIREYASHTRGAVTPPWLFASLRHLAQEHADHLALREDARAQANRSDCVVMMQVTPNVILCGPPVVGRHYRSGPYRCSAFDVAHLARSLVMMAMRFQPATP
ncbi:hypothetical protein BH23DEI1_BH23DEI1_16400 [soil metagenome]